jgi:predicted ABC-type ATPase
MFTKDKSKFHKGSSELNITSLKHYMKSGQNFIYDTTGSNDIGVFEVTKDAHKYGYKIMFILILIDIETAKIQNKKRGMTGGHTADDDYIDYVYSNQLQTTRNYLKYVKPDAFYVVLNKDGNYKYYKFDTIFDHIKALPLHDQRQYLPQLRLHKYTINFFIIY